MIWDNVPNVEDSMIYRMDNVNPAAKILSVRQELANVDQVFAFNV